MDLFNIVGGVVLILYGLRFLRKGFARVMAGDMLDWLQGFTRTRARSLIGGIAGGTVMPSSTAMALVSVQMTRRRRVSWENVFAVLLGAHLGTTVLVQALSLNLQEYAGIFVAVGGILYLFVDASRMRGVGQSLLAFGFVLLGMGLLSAAGRSAGGDPATVDLFAALGELPVLFVLGAMLLTLLVQSVTASMAVALALVAMGEVNIEMLLLWVLGANIGVCLTLLLAGWAHTEGRRLGVATLFIKVPLAVIGAVVLIAMPGEMLERLPGELPQQAAWTHTLFNLVACASVLMARPIGRWMAILIPAPEAASLGKQAAARLDSTLLQNPTLAVNAALRETLEILDNVHVMRNTILQAVRHGEWPEDVDAEVDRRAGQVLRARDELVRYLDAISDDTLSAEDQALKDALDDVMRELPSIVEILGRDQLQNLRRLQERNPQALEQSRPVLVEAGSRLSRLTESVARMLMRERPLLARDVIRRKQENSRWFIQAKRSDPRMPHALWKILDDFQQLNRRLSSVAYVYGREPPEADRMEL